LPSAVRDKGCASAVGRSEKWSAVRVAKEKVVIAVSGPLAPVIACEMEPVTPTFGSKLRKMPSGSFRAFIKKLIQVL